VRNIEELQHDRATRDSCGCIASVLSAAGVVEEHFSHLRPHGLSGARRPDPWPPRSGSISKILQRSSPTSPALDTSGWGGVHPIGFAKACSARPYLMKA
jgi:hypothetical protein